MEERGGGIARRGVAEGDRIDLVGVFGGEFPFADMDAEEDREIGFLWAVVEFARLGADHAESGFLKDLAAESVDEGFSRADFSTGKRPKFASPVLFDHEDFSRGILNPSHGGNLFTGFFGWNNDRSRFSSWHFWG